MSVSGEEGEVYKDHFEEGKIVLKKATSHVCRTKKYCGYQVCMCAQSVAMSCLQATRSLNTTLTGLPSPKPSILTVSPRNLIQISPLPSKCPVASVAMDWDTSTLTTDPTQESHGSEYTPPPFPSGGRERGRGLGIRDGSQDGRIGVRKGLIVHFPCKCHCYFVLCGCVI